MQTPDRIASDDIKSGLVGTAINKLTSLLDDNDGDATIQAVKFKFAMDAVRQASEAVFNACNVRTVVGQVPAPVSADVVFVPVDTVDASIIIVSKEDDELWRRMEFAGKLTKTKPGDILFVPSPEECKVRIAAVVDTIKAAVMEPIQELGRRLSHLDCEINVNSYFVVNFVKDIGTAEPFSLGVLDMLTAGNKATASGVPPAVGTKRKATPFKGRVISAVDAGKHMALGRPRYFGVDYKCFNLTFEDGAKKTVLTYANFRGDPCKLRLGYLCTKCGVTATPGGWSDVKTNPLCKRCKMKTKKLAKDAYGYADADEEGQGEDEGEDEGEGEDEE